MGFHLHSLSGNSPFSQFPARPKISESSQPDKLATRLFKSVANGNAISWFCLPIRSAPLKTPSGACPRVLVTPANLASTTFNEQLRGLWDFRRYPAGIRDISSLNSQQIVRNDSLRIYLYFLCQTDHAEEFQIISRVWNSMAVSSSFRIFHIARLCVSYLAFIALRNNFSWYGIEMNSVDTLTKALNDIVYRNSVMQDIAEESLIAIANVINYDAKGNACIYVIRIELFVNICLFRFFKVLLKNIRM